MWLWIEHGPNEASICGGWALEHPPLTTTNPTCTGCSFSSAFFTVSAVARWRDSRSAKLADIYNNSHHVQQSTPLIWHQHSTHSSNTARLPHSQLWRESVRRGQCTTQHIILLTIFTGYIHNPINSDEAPKDKMVF